MPMRRRARRAAAVAWAAFLAAALLEVAVFAFVDPGSLRTLGGAAVELSAATVYSLAFLGFWGSTAVACVLTEVLQRSAEDINAAPMQQPDD
jgi:hypothetical protein